MGTRPCGSARRAGFAGALVAVAAVAAMAAAAGCNAILGNESFGPGPPGDDAGVDGTGIDARSRDGPLPDRARTPDSPIAGDGAPDAAAHDAVACDAATCATLVRTSKDPILALVADGMNDLYWTTKGRLTKCPATANCTPAFQLPGSYPGPLVFTTAAFSSVTPGGDTLFAAVYEADGGVVPYEVEAVPAGTTGSSARAATEPSSIAGLSAHSNGDGTGELYWCTSKRVRGCSVSTSGGCAALMIATPPSPCTALVIDPTGQYLSWAETRTMSTEIGRCDLSAMPDCLAPLIVSVPSGGSIIDSMAAAANGNTYIAVPGTHQVLVMSASGAVSSTAFVTVTGLSHVAADDTNLYMTTQNGVEYCPLAAMTCAALTLLASSGPGALIANDTKNVYWTDTSNTVYLHALPP